MKRRGTALALVVAGCAGPSATRSRTDARTNRFGPIPVIMGLDVDTPDPPSLRGPQDVGDYDSVDEADDEAGDDARRSNLEGFLREGAWNRAFDEWAEHTLLSAEEFEFVTALDLFDELDFYWNEAEGDVGYRVPPVPSRSKLPAPYDERFDAGDLDGIEEEFDSLARTVTEVLEAEYVDDDGGEYGFFADG